MPRTTNCHEIRAPGQDVRSTRLQSEKAAWSFKRLEKPWVDIDWRRERSGQQSLDCAVMQETGEITLTSEQAWQ